MSAHTPGPWRWKFNAEHKTVDLVGGRHLTVMDFARWGMGKAVPRFRDTEVGGMNLMDRLCDKPEWIAPEPGREHHKRWHQLVTHPDARLIEAAPDMLAALIVARELISTDRNTYAAANTPPDRDEPIDRYDRDVLADYDAALLQIDAAITKATGGAA
jgi:hypothetical protein